MSLFAQKLQPVVGIQDAQIDTPSSDSGNAEVESLGNQLDDLYKDVEYVTSHFPNHSVRSLVDYCKSLETRLASKPTAGGVPQANGIIPGEVIANLSSLTQAQSDQVDLGIVEVDNSGMIKLYNRYEAELAGVDQKAVLGKNFFTEVAPCTNNRLFLGRFKQGVESGAMDFGFNYTFTYKMKPTQVQIHLFRDIASGRNFIFVRKR
ncbi:MAG: PAS domain-containing protein [Oligoflexus sp.]|nr:PAS domain-containing protein [Oligoflexus sp.]